MANLLRVCRSCGKYSLKDICSDCGKTTNSAHPPKYSKEDKYAIYRRKELFPRFFSGQA